MNCRKSSMIEKYSQNFAQSTYSDEATHLGGNQKVVSYSLFLRDGKSKLGSSGYFQGVRENLAGMKKFYPGWVMRIYSNFPLEEDMCAVICSDQDIYYCDVSHLPGIGDVRKVHPMAWRFLLIGDETVEQFVVRDLDSRLSQRERDAVDNWEASEFAIHGMRDHPQHGTEIMGGRGMWGGNNSKLGLPIGAKIRRCIMDIKWKKLGYNDQQILAQEIYSKCKDLILTHDSYLRLVFKDNVPFPTKRLKNNRFVGQPIFTKNEPSPLPLPSHCSMECRPENGRDWEYF